MEGSVNVVALYSQLVPDWDDVYYGYAAVGMRIGEFGTVAASCTYLTYGEQAMTDPGSPDIVGYFTPYEVIPSIAFGAALGEYLGVGLNVKYIKVHLAPAWATQDQRKGEGSSVAVDLGALARLSHGVEAWDGLFRVGGAVQHIGPQLEYIDEEQADPLPRTLRLGASYQPAYDDVVRGLWCVEYRKLILDDADDSGALGFGAEVQGSLVAALSLSEGQGASGMRDVLVGRLGYVYDEDGAVEGFSYGFGLGLEATDTAMLGFDLANVPQAEGLSRPWRIGGSGWFAS